TPCGSQMMTPSSSASKTCSKKPFSRTSFQSSACTSPGETRSSRAISFSKNPVFMERQGDTPTPGRQASGASVHQLVQRVFDDPLRAQLLEPRDDFAHDL